MNRTYDKVSGGSDNNRWEPNKSTVAIDPANPPQIEGYYTDINERVGKEGPFNVHEITTLNPDGSLGESFDVSLGTGTDSTLKKVKVGSWVCIQYKGKKQNPKTGRTFNDTDVFVDNNAVPYADMLKAAGSTATQSTTQPGKDVTATSNNANAFPEDDSELPF